MSINISNYITSILNPNGRFKTLEGIYAVRDAEGEPLMLFTELTVDFETVYGGERYTLKCLLENDNAHIATLKEISMYTTHIDCPYLTPYTYLENEMIVFNHAGRAEYSDVLLQRKPDGMRLDAYMHDLAEKGDCVAIANILDRLAAMAEWFVDSEFSHGNICSKNIYITALGMPVLVNYDRSSRQRSHNDIIAIASLAAAIYVTACRPEIYDDIIHDKILTASGLRKLTMLFTDIMSNEKAEELNDVFSMVAAANEVSDEAVCMVIKKLSKTALCSYAALENIAGHIRGRASKSTARDFAKYSYIGEMQDMLMRVCDGLNWFYIDRNGNVTIPGPFVTAEDFSEGRAVVETKSGYGLINVEGNFVIEPDCCDLEWNSIDNIAIVTIEGKSGLFSRDGVKLTELIYDQILPCSEGFLPFKLNGKYGFLRRDGTDVIKPVYDDAFCFKDGFARVKLGNRILLIDHEGNRIDELKKQRNGRSKHMVKN